MPEGWPGIDNQHLLARDGLAAAEEALACFEPAIELARKKGALA